MNGRICARCETENDRRRSHCGWCGAAFDGSADRVGRPPSGPVPAEWYDREYFETWCGGGEGEGLGPPLELAWSLAGVEPGMSVLDVGCGRGEILERARAAGARATGVDSSPAGLDIAAERLGSAVGLVQADATALPLASGCFDRVFLNDIVEHLWPDQLDLTLREVRRVLAVGGRLVVHTMPNVWYLRFGYPVVRRLQRLRLVERLPAEPRSLHARRLHVNEQSPASLGQALRRAGLPGRIVVAKFADRPGSPYDLRSGGAADRLRGVLEALRTLPGVLRLRDLVFYRAWPMSYLFDNDIFAVCDG